MHNLAISIFNFLILVIFLGYKLKTPFIEFVRSRHHTIRNEVETTQIQLRQAQEKYDEFSAKLKAIHAEVASLKEQTRQEAEAIKERLITEAHRLASGIVSDAK